MQIAKIMCTEDSETAAGIDAMQSRPKSWALVGDRLIAHSKRSVSDIWKEHLSNNEVKASNNNDTNPIGKAGPCQPSVSYQHQL